MALRRNHPKFLVIDGCPCPYDVAPYVYLVLRRAGQTATSIYRGSDAASILHAHGKMTQAEVHRAYPAISNPPGFSQHELHSDGVGNPRVPRGGRLKSWQIGVDSGTNDTRAKARIEDAARHYGWHVKHPYSRGVEGHHWCFATKPHPHSRWQKLKLAAVRRRLPRR
jgi:hypothetical protein